MIEPSDRLAIRVGSRSLSYAELLGAAGAVASRVSGMSRVAVVATPTLETCVAVVGALLAGVPSSRSTRSRGARARAHPLGLLARRRVPGRRRTSPRARTSPLMSPTPRRRAGRLHVRDDRAAEGRRPAAAGAVVEPRRAGRRLGVDRRRRRRPRPAAVPRARTDPGRARAAAARRLRAGTWSASPRRRRRRPWPATRRCSSACRRCTTGWPTPESTRRWPRGCAAPGCSSPARPHCRPPTTRASRPRAASSWSSATG